MKFNWWVLLDIGFVVMLFSSMYFVATTYMQSENILEVLFGSSLLLFFIIPNLDIHIKYIFNNYKGGTINGNTNKNN